MNNLITIYFKIKNCKNGKVQVGSHELTVSVHKDVIKNKERLLSHCTSIGKKTYGRPVIVERVVDYLNPNNILWGK